MERERERSSFEFGSASQSASIGKVCSTPIERFNLEWAPGGRVVEPILKYMVRAEYLAIFGEVSSTGRHNKHF